jgi:hypothetical protein
MKPRSTIIGIALCCIPLIVRADAVQREKLIRPWNSLKSLSEDQQARIMAIHRKALKEIAEIKRREREQILQLLDEDQLKELQAIEGKQLVDRKLQSDRKRAATAPATAP